MDKSNKNSPSIDDMEEEYEEEDEEIEDYENEEDEISLEDNREIVDDAKKKEIIFFDEIEDDNPEEPTEAIKTQSNVSKSVHIAESLSKTNTLLEEEQSKHDHSGIRVVDLTEAEAQSNLKQLLNIDLNNTSREDIIDLLMKTEFKPSSAVNTSKIKPNKYNVESHYNPEKLQNNTMTVNGKFKLNLNESKVNAENKTDYNTTIRRLKNKLLNEPELKEQKVYKILFADNERIQYDAERLSGANTEYIANKVKGYLVKKQKKIDNIAEAMNEDMKQKCTFNPDISTNNPEYDQKEKRTFEEFLQDQNKHLEKVERKVEEIQKKKDKEEQQIQDGARPKIDTNSQKIFEKKIKTEDKPYERLYKQRFSNAKNDIVENYGKHVRSNTETKFSKEIRKKGDKIEEFLLQKEKDKKPSNKKETDEYIKKLYERANEKKEKFEKLKSKVINEETKGIGLTTASYSSNKFVLKNIMKKYKFIINTIFANIVKQTVRTTLDYDVNLNQEEDPILSQVELNRISLLQMDSVLQQLGFVTESSNEESQSLNASLQRESMHKLEEKKLSCDIWEALKDKDGYVNVDHLFIFILAVINLYEYYLYSSFKKSGFAVNSAEEVPIEKNKTKRDAKEKEAILSKISNDINSRIMSQGKYCSYDTEKNFLITFEKSKLIQKDFGLFYINFMNSNSISKKKSIQSQAYTSVNTELKPQINRNSEKLYVEYRNKLVNVK